MRFPSNSIYEEWSVDEVAEARSGISKRAYRELWDIVLRAESEGRDIPTIWQVWHQLSAEVQGNLYPLLTNQEFSSKDQQYTQRV